MKIYTPAWDQNDFFLEIAVHAPLVRPVGAGTGKLLLALITWVVATSWTWFNLCCGSGFDVYMASGSVLFNRIMDKDSNFMIPDPTIFLDF